MKVITLFLFVFGLLSSYAQTSLGIIDQENNKLLSYYQSGLYEAVVSEVSKSPSTLDAYLVEISRMRLGKGNAERLEKLIESNPGHPFNSTARYLLGNRSFINNDLNEAQQYFRSIDVTQLEENEQADYYFKHGYLFLQNKDFKRANTSFRRSQRIRNEDKLSYYLGFTYYHLGNKEEAIRYLEEVEEDEFISSANYFISAMLLEQNKYDEVIERSRSELTEEKSETNAGFYQLIGEAYSKSGESFRAYQYFSKAIELKPTEPSATLWYQAGIASFKNGKNHEAIQRLERAGLQGGEFASLSAFQLGRVFLEEKQYEKSLLAYTEAISSKDPEMNEEATFYAAKLNLQSKNFPEGIKYLDDYLEKYPDGKWIEESKELLAESYLRTSNYDQAIEHLKSIGITTNSQRGVYQKVTFQKAQLAFNDAKFQSAIEWFQESNKFLVDSELGRESNLLIAESYFQLTDFLKSLVYFKRAGNDEKSAYGVGYSLFNLKRYDEAISYFKRVSSGNSNAAIRTDAKLRLADCQYATKEYSDAKRTYQELNRVNPTAYQYYQLGIVSSEQGQSSEAITYLGKSIELDRRVFGDDASFKIGEINFEQTKFKEAELYFSEIIDRFPSSRYIDQALLNRAVCRTNLGDLDNASRDYRLILLDHMRSGSSFDALLGLQSLASRGVEIRNLSLYIDSYKKANPESKTVELVEFEYAKGLYFDLNYADAVTSLNSFLVDYPESVDSTEVRYYLADSYYRSSDFENARVEFERLSEFNNTWTGRTLDRLGNIYFRLEYYADAIANYQKLVDLRISPKDTYNGRIGLLKSYYIGQNFVNTITVADSIITSNWQPLNATRNALLYKVRSYLSLERYDDCRKAIESVEDRSDVISAEVEYSGAKIEFLEGKYEASNEMLFEFNSAYGSYQSWIDRSYLLIADNYVGMGELFQAKATLNSILEHSESIEIKRLANEKLLYIEQQSINDTTTVKGEGK